jgi:hypothetical protein
MNQARREKRRIPQRDAPFLFMVLRLFLGCGLSGWSFGRGRLGGSGVGDGIIDELIELAAIDNLDKGRAFGVGGDYPNGRSVLNAYALA